MPPTHNFSHFIAACELGIQFVWVSKGAMEGAQKDFQLYTQEEVLQFIAAGGLAEPEFVNTRPFDNWKGAAPAPMVDAYKFRKGEVSRGYIAFFFPSTQRWVIKSFKQDDAEAGLNKGAFRGLQNLLSEQSREEGQ